MNKQSPWGTPQSPPKALAGQQSGSGGVFGGNAAASSPFMKLSSTRAPESGSSPFAGFGNKVGASPFAKQPGLPTEPSGSTGSFGTASSIGTTNTAFGGIGQTPLSGGMSQNSTGSSFGKPSAAQPVREERMEEDDVAEKSSPPSSPFNLSAEGFKLGSTFKGDGTAKDDLPKPSNPGAGLFGAGFGDALGAAAEASSPELPSIKKARLPHELQQKYTPDTVICTTSTGSRRTTGTTPMPSTWQSRRTTHHA